MTSVISDSLHESFSKSVIITNVNLELSGGHAMVGTVSHRLFAAETQVRSHDLCCREASQQPRGPVVYILPLGTWDCGRDTRLLAYLPSSCTDILVGPMHRPVSLPTRPNTTKGYSYNKTKEMQ